MTTKTSPAVDRVVSVLNFFLEHSDEPFTLTQVATSLRLSRATTHSILLGFVKSGYLYRRNDKSYVLGSLLPSLAANAKQRASSVPMVRHELRALADELDLVASVLFAEGEEVVVRDRIASVSHLGRAHRITGVRYPLYPWGNVFLIPLSRDAIVAQLDSAVAEPSAEMKSNVLNEVAFGKKYGFIVSFMSSREEPEFNHLALEDMFSSPDPSKRQLPWYIDAPVIGINNEVSFSVSLFGFTELMNADEVLEVGKKLRDTCDRLSQFYIKRAD